MKSMKVIHRGQRITAYSAAIRGLLVYSVISVVKMVFFRAFRGYTLHG